jgi:hypothetical protein
VVLIFRGTALVDKFGVMCKDWEDPEDIGIQYYTIACESFWIAPGSKKVFI